MFFRHRFGCDTSLVPFQTPMRRLLSRYVCALVVTRHGVPFVSPNVDLLGTGRMKKVGGDECRRWQLLFSKKPRSFGIFNAACNPRRWATMILMVSCAFWADPVCVRDARARDIVHGWVRVVVVVLVMLVLGSGGDGDDGGGGTTDWAKHSAKTSASRSGCA
jgi:hypothetical protein